MPTWSPAAWNDFGVVGLLTVVCFLLCMGLVRGWVVLGFYYRETIAGKDRALAELRERAAIDAETIKLQAKTISERDAVEDAATRLLKAFRDAAGGQ